MAKRITSFMKPAENINMPKPKREDIERQMDASHKAIRDALEYHNTRGGDIDENTSKKIADVIKFHREKLAALHELAALHDLKNSPQK